MAIIPREPTLTAAKCRILYIYTGMEELLNKNKNNNVSNINDLIEIIKKMYSLSIIQNDNDNAMILLRDINYCLSTKILCENDLNNDIIKELHLSTCEALNPRFKYQYEIKYSDDNILFNKMLTSYNCNNKFKDELIRPTYINIK